MAKTLKPFLFVKSIVSWGKNAEDAREHLYNIFDDQEGDEIYENWDCDEVKSADPTFIKGMGTVEEDDDELWIKRP